MQQVLLTIMALRRSQWVPMPLTRGEWRKLTYPNVQGLGLGSAGLLSAMGSTSCRVIAGALG
jgi:hypothetical protein